MALKKSDLMLVNRGSDSYKSTLSGFVSWLTTEEGGLVIPSPVAGPGIVISTTSDDKDEIAVKLATDSGLMFHSSGGLMVRVDNTSTQIIDGKVVSVKAQDSEITDLARQVQVTTASNSKDYNVFFGEQNGASPVHSDAQLKYNPSTDELFSTKFNGKFVGDGSQLQNLPAGISNGVSINYGNNTDSQYPLLFGSGNSVNASTPIYINPGIGAYYGNQYHASAWFYSTGNTGWYNATHKGGWYMDSSSYIKTSGDAHVYAYKNIYAVGDIVAFASDERLKNIEGSIDNALDKVCGLSGFYYTFNEKAKKLGHIDERQVGVSAQKVKEVLPEVVSRAPFDIAVTEDGVPYSESGEDYLTVKYEKLVPLLIEAIKELKSEVDQLKGKK